MAVFGHQCSLATVFKTVRGAPPVTNSDHRLIYSTFLLFSAQTCDTSDSTVKQYGANCYQFMSAPPGLSADTDQWTRADAADACEDLGEDYYLARVENQEEQDWLRTTLYNNFPSFDRAYIGGHEAVGEWTWLLGKLNKPPPSRNRSKIKPYSPNIILQSLII